MKERWMLKRISVNIGELASECKISKISASVLANRGITDIGDIRKYFRASLTDMYDPFLMKDMKKGIDIIKRAIEDKKNIVIYGDYDADGVTSTVILFKALCKCNAKVSYYIPDREAEGYGINCNRLRTLKEEGAEIILTCDNGISALEQIDFAKTLGLQVVITDHHELPFTEDNEGNRSEVIPAADAVINPKQKNCEYPFKKLCGAGIALKFSEALYSEMGMVENVEDLVEIAGIGTICDIVDLIDENRIIAKNSIALLNETKNMGLSALIDVLGLRGKKISSFTIGYMIGPCINATGRLETAALSAELLLCEDPNRAKELAQILTDLNKKRQEMTNRNVEELISLIDASKLVKDKVLVVYNEEVHESIAGIVAGKLRERYNVPTLVLTKGKEMPKGSGRSIEEYNLYDELNKCKDLIYKFGGHPMAAGLSVKEENIELLREVLNRNCTLSDEDIIPKIRIDHKVPFKEITYDLIDELEALEPFGKGNETPVFAEKNVLVDRIFIMGKEANVLKLSMRTKDSIKRIDAIGFSKVLEFKEMLTDEYGDNAENIMENPQGLELDIIFYPYVNEYNGFSNIQLRLSSFRLSK